MPDRMVTLRRRFERDRSGVPFSVGWDVLYQPREGDRERKVGFFTLDRRRFYTWRDEARHRAVLVDGYGIDVALVEFFDRVPELETVAVTVRAESGRARTYFTSLYAWLVQGQRRVLSPDWGEQVFLTVAQLDEQDRIYRRVQSRSSATELPNVVQLELPV